MEAKVYKGYLLWGHVIRQGHEYAASDTVTRNNKLVETSGVLGSFESEDEAQLAGLDWCRAWVDNHSNHS
ncbi:MULTISPECIES: hypothetical protein [Burkholderia]|uniref:Transposase n=2 Tax=Burkholderia cepacia complex TaxID=87882 RepID=A0A2S5DZP6_9BURK|nr:MULTISPECIES: hypothetical protein [Burkholderia]EKS9796314.1 hypothetical protein [Burkholderia cepacia]EKS9802948.1 hypothetical protein [Burkholderia cepacia]EKS9810432.1 hypothetical protein [Burkholderia cepacia]EKS9817597.1 hypothetical protein [Burkholderia cepacia]EKS9824530.1 hypothetical protein [Burkholderia cepacia]